MVRFFDSTHHSERTHKYFENVFQEVEKKQIYRGIIMHQIDCDDSKNLEFCQEMRILEKPEILIIRENKVNGYFTMKRDPSDMDFEAILGIYFQIDFCFQKTCIIYVKVQISDKIIFLGKN